MTEFYRSRVVQLGGIAALLLGALLFRQYGDVPAGLPDFQSNASLQAKAQSMRQIIATQESVNSAYMQAVEPYAITMAGAQTLMPKGQDPRAFLERMIRDAVTQHGPVRDLSLVVGESAARGDGIHQLRITLSFVGGDRTALGLISALGLPERGSLWDELTVTADPKSKTVSVSGQLVAMVIEAAE